MEEATWAAVRAVESELDGTVELLRGELAALDPKEAHREIRKRLSPAAAEAWDLALLDVERRKGDTTPDELRTEAQCHVFDLVAGYFDFRSAVVVMECGTPRYAGVTPGMDTDYVRDRRVLEQALGALVDGWGTGSRSRELFNSTIEKLRGESLLAARALSGAHYTLEPYVDVPQYVDALGALSRRVLGEYQVIHAARKNLTRMCREALEVFEPAAVEDD